MSDDLDLIRSRIAESARVISALEAHARSIHRAADALAETLHAGGTILTCGNGGSAAEALHLSEELIGKFHRVRPPLRAVCLNADPTALTCIANDFGFEDVFERQLRGLGRAGDALVAFSTSGGSENVRRALVAAQECGLRRIGLLGGDGGACAPLCDLALIAPSDATAHVQEAHQTLLHILIELIEHRLFDADDALTS